MTGHIFIYGGIGREKGEISFDNVKEQITQAKAAEDLTVHLISPGGDVFEGEAIYNALRNTGKKITTHLEGTVASIATLIAAAGDTMVMNKTARFMIHNPKIQGFGQMADSRDLRHVANQLDQIKELLISVYDRKTKLGKEKLWELYDNETWLTADEAQKMGFVDDTQDAIKAVATININHIMEAKDKGLWAKIQNLFSMTKFKNEFTETLEDGRVVVVLSDDEDWTNKQVVLETGEALEDGTFKLKSGKSIVVAGGVITGTEATPPQDNTNEMDEKIKQLEAQLAEAKAAKDSEAQARLAAEGEVAKAKAETLKIQNRVTTIEKDFIKLQEATLQTVGDKNPPAGKGPVIKNLNQQQQIDPMGEFALKYYRNRNIIKDHDED